MRLCSLTVLLALTSWFLPAQAAILVVDDFSTGYDWQTLWSGDLSALGVDAQFVAAAAVDSASMSASDAVVWNCGNDTSDPLSSGERDLIASYLDQGGRLLLVSPGFPAQVRNSGDHSWLKQRLGCDYVMPNSTITWSCTYLGLGFEGVEDSVLEGVEFDLTFGPSADVPADDLTLVHGTDDGSMHLISLKEIPGYLGVARQTPSDRTILLTFPLESVQPALARRAILGQSLAWLTGPRYEARGVWVVRNQLTSESNIDQVVSSCVDAGFNALVVQVRGRGDAYYQSATEPEAVAGFDPLQRVIDQAHARGMQVHAWMNAGYVWGTGSLPADPDHILNRHPEYAMINRSGKSMLDYTSGEFSAQYAEGRYLSLAAPAVQDYLSGVFAEVVANYAVDGVHFDFIRYPARGVSEAYDLDYNPLVIAAFEAEKGFDPLTVAVDSEAFQIWLEWQRERIGQLVGRIRSEAHAERPGIRVSAAVLSRYHLGRHQATQDWIGWLQRGQIDTVCPMSYGSDNELVVQEGLLAQENRASGSVWLGLGANHDIELIIDRIAQVRQTVHPEGLMFFAWSSRNSTEMNELRQRPFVAPALVPPVTAAVSGSDLSPVWSLY